MKTLVFTGVLLGSALVYVKTRAPHARRGGLEGKWEIVEWPEAWKRGPGSQLTITPGEVKIVAGFIPAVTMHYQADEENGTIDATRTSDGKTVEQQGLYERDGDTLTL